MPAFSRSVGYLGNAWCSSDSQILARNGVFVVTVACKSKTTQSALCLDEASAECQARTPRKRRMRISSVACGISNAHGRKSRYQDTGRSLLWCAVVSTRSPAAGRARATPPAGYWVRWRRQAERAQTRCAVHANAKETHFTAKDRAMAPRPTYRNTKGICTSTPARERNPTGPQSHPGGRGRAAAVARCRGGRRLSARGPRHLSARDPRRLSARGPRHLSAWSERTAHRACARSGGLLQRTQ